MILEQLKYPVGKFVKPESITTELIDSAISEIENFPKLVKAEIQNLDEQDLQLRYRPGGWTISQVVHHCADSHINSYVRFKLALTENIPTIKPYEESLWADLQDKQLSPFVSLKLLEALHERWVYILKSLSEEDLSKEFIHPEQSEKISLTENILIYSWHCRHHLAHIRQAKELRF
ncbi:DinB superfamily protein [Epilithonimonas bovis DSM 19482]|uniref:DinB superfamily protein n=1 Tax=Epilithonimonas bovis DSM 19482 TaxID=1121284 RepID=A0A1U7PVC2_9FLAO|nr:putative metal-dependent hydrolase [Epilithonimonas bovis]SIT95902.1 DinB superfamily protein [Epilithonimonas bovis DSM 19482]